MITIDKLYPGSKMNFETAQHTADENMHDETEGWTYTVERYLDTNFYMILVSDELGYSVGYL